MNQLTVNAKVRQEAMYGCTEADLRSMVEDSFSFKLSGASMVVMSMLSDAQEEIAHGMAEDARQTINRAKWVIRTYLKPETAF